MLDYNENAHTYSLDGKELISCTQLLQKHHLSPSYEGVDSELLQASALKGQAIHKEVEDYFKNGTIGISNELQAVISFVKQNGLQVVSQEEVVHNDIVAGRYDLIYKTQDDEFVRVDIKTTTTKHLDSVSWQLSIYDYLDKNKCSRLELWHLKDNRLQVVDIPFKEKEEIDRLMQAEREGLPFEPQELEVSEKELAKLNELQIYISQLKRLQDNANEELDKLKQVLVNRMEQHNIKSFKNENLSITYVAPYESQRVDSAKLKKDYPQVYESCIKTTKTKANVKITIKGE